MQKLQAVHIRPTSNPIFTPIDLKSCSHVFLRHDAVQNPIQLIYDGRSRSFKDAKRLSLSFKMVQIDCFPRSRETSLS
ncbi:hypothetical protein ACTXT7_014779 [Hymenolepis weldensis]